MAFPSIIHNGQPIIQPRAEAPVEETYFLAMQVLLQQKLLNGQKLPEADPGGGG